MPTSDPPPAPGAGRAADAAGSVPPWRPAAAGNAAPPPAAPGLGEQIGATRDSAKGLIGAHVELAKSELADIADAAKSAAVFAGIALVSGIVAALVVTVGLPLFLGEALFGSIGWGILLGVLFLSALALAAIVAALRPGIQASVGRAFLTGLIVGVVVGVALGLDLTNRGWSALGDVIVPAMDPAYRPLVVAVAGLALVGAVVGLILGAVRVGGGAAVGGLFGGAIAGVFLGLLTGFAPGPRVGAAIGVTAGLITWITAMGLGIARGGFNTDALKDRFWPARTIEATKETIQWARERKPLWRRS